MANKKPKIRTTKSNKGMGNNIEKEARAALFADPVVKTLIDDIENKPALESPYTTGANGVLQVKDAFIKVRVPQQIKELLTKVCEGQGVDEARVVRALIHYYVKSYSTFIRS